MPAVILAPQLMPSIGKLTPKEQARVVSFITTFQADPSNPGISLERLHRARSKNVWSGRITRDLRAILYKDGSTWAIICAGHHDEAYEWAERREIGRHSVIGSLQIVEAVETVREVERIIEVQVSPEVPATFADHSDEYLLSLGVPETWLPTVRQVRDDDQLLVVCERLPPEIGDRLFLLAAGEFVTPPVPNPPDQPVTRAADTRSRFYLVEDVAGLQAALAAPLDRWVAFLHPAQRELVERQYSGPAKVSGSAGTGKTVVGMHRARHLAKAGEQVLFTTYVKTLCENIEINLDKLCAGEVRERIDVSTVHTQALRLVRLAEPRARPARDNEADEILERLRVRYAHTYEARFVRAEWDYVVRLQGLESWAEYRKARRTGRGRALSVRARKDLWKVFGGVLEDLRDRGAYDWSGLCRRAADLIEEGAVCSPFTAVIVDEVQDLKPPEIRFLRALCGERLENLMLCGDAGQRIYPGGFSLSALGIEVRGRASILRINYRTTEQIRRLADRMLGEVTDDLDGGTETRSGTRSLLRGPNPVLVARGSQHEELEAAVGQIQRWCEGGLNPESIGVFARTSKRLESLSRVLDDASIAWRSLAGEASLGTGGVRLGTMHRAKGLEFKVVLVLDCGDAVVPHPASLRGLDDPQDLEAASAREQRLLYVAMTRARDELVVSWTGRPSRYLSPLLDEPS